MKILNTLFVFVVALLSRLSVLITGSSRAVIPSQPQLVTSTEPLPPEIPVLSPSGRLTEAQQLMSSLATMKINHQRLSPPQSADARAQALAEAADRRARRSLRRQGLLA